MADNHVAHTSNVLAVNIKRVVGADNSASVAGSIAQHDEWRRGHELALCCFICLGENLADIMPETYQNPSFSITWHNDKNRKCSDTGLRLSKTILKTVFS